MTTPRGNRPTTIQALLDQLFQVSTEQRDNPLIAQAEVTVTQLFRANPSRIAFNLTNLGANPVYLWSDNQVSTTRGVRLNASGGTVTVLYDEDFSRTGYEWFVIADGGVSAIASQEVLIGS